MYLVKAGTYLVSLLIKYTLYNIIYNEQYVTSKLRRLIERSFVYWNSLEVGTRIKIH